MKQPTFRLRKHLHCADSKTQTSKHCKYLKNRTGKGKNFGMSTCQRRGRELGGRRAPHAAPSESPMTRMPATRKRASMDSSLWWCLGSNEARSSCTPNQTLMMMLMLLLMLMMMTARGWSVRVASPTRRANKWLDHLHSLMTPTASAGVSVDATATKSVSTLTRGQRLLRMMAVPPESGARRPCCR
jgi:hypothetical protein